MSTPKTGLIGHPVSQSKSPLIHAYWMKAHNIDSTYQALDISPDVLKDGVSQLIKDGYQGFNVTVPHKQAIFELCDEVDGTAKAIGAVNTVSIKGGKLYGTNTDAFGFMENIRKNAPRFDAGAAPCVVLGAGGGARAVIHALIEAGAQKIIVLNRTEQRAREIRSMNEKIIHTAEWEHRADILKNAGFLVNTTSSGMVGKDKLDIDLTQLPKEALVCDIVYVPLMTDLLQAAKARGNPVVTGIGMLLYQAQKAFEIWHGVAPEIDTALEEIVLQ